jgi:hypothetical protein
MNKKKITGNNNNLTKSNASNLFSFKELLLRNSTKISTTVDHIHNSVLKLILMYTL